MTSSDGITWTTRTSAADNTWYGVTYGNGLFVAVAGSGSGNRVMTSPDGITWTSRTSAATNYWVAVTYGNGLFVAVACGIGGACNSTAGKRGMTSSDGVTWTSRTAAANNSWYGITYGNGLFVAVSQSGSGNRVMTSPDGITWTSRTSAADNSWTSVTYGNGLFVAVSSDGTGNRVMTSPEHGAQQLCSRILVWPLGASRGGRVTGSSMTRYSTSAKGISRVSGATFPVSRAGDPPTGPGYVRGYAPFSRQECGQAAFPPSAHPRSTRPGFSHRKPSGLL